MIHEINPLEVLGTNIRKLRKKKNLSQEDFAHQAGIDRSYVGQIERGERNLSFRNLCRIAQALNVTVSELVEEV